MCSRTTIVLKISPMEYMEFFLFSIYGSLLLKTSFYFIILMLISFVIANRNNNKKHEIVLIAKNGKQQRV